MKSFAQTIKGVMGVNDVSVVTLVIWLGCLTVGVLGLVLPYDRSLPPKAASSLPPKVEMLNVQLTEETPPLSEPKPQVSLTPPNAVVTPNIPQPVAVAQPSPAIAFALPVKGPTRIVPVAQAAYTQAPTTNAAVTAPSAPTPQTLTFGQGEGRQPKPEYPLRAQREGQQGNVTIRFTVGTDGRVVNAAVQIPSPWILLNDSALHTVQDRWRFSAGPERLYDVVIVFNF